MRKVFALTTLTTVLSVISALNAQASSPAGNKLRLRIDEDRSPVKRAIDPHANYEVWDWCRTSGKPFPIKPVDRDELYLGTRTLETRNNE